MFALGIIILVVSLLVGAVAVLFSSLGAHWNQGGASTWSETRDAWIFGGVAFLACFIGLSLLVQVVIFVLWMFGAVK